jgi:hypothetical protein
MTIQTRSLGGVVGVEPLPEILKGDIRPVHVGLGLPRAVGRGRRRDIGGSLLLSGRPGTVATASREPPRRAGPSAGSNPRRSRTCILPEGALDDPHDAGLNRLGEPTPGSDDGGQIGVGLTGVVDTRRSKRSLM